MKVSEYNSPALQALQNLRILSYIGKDEEFNTEADLVGEVLLRASASALMAYETDRCTYEEFCDAAVELEQFCSIYGYDFHEYCYDMESIQSQTQTGGLSR